VAEGSSLVSITALLNPRGDSAKKDTPIFGSPRQTVILTFCVLNSLEMDSHLDIQQVLEEYVNAERTDTARNMVTEFEGQALSNKALIGLKIRKWFPGDGYNKYFHGQVVSIKQGYVPVVYVHFTQQKYTHPLSLTLLSIFFFFLTPTALMVKRGTM